MQVIVVTLCLCMTVCEEIRYDLLQFYHALCFGRRHKLLLHTAKHAVYVIFNIALP
ncbi:hypothetical protein D3C71_2112570 [compost metagenome]